MHEINYGLIKSNVGKKTQKAEYDGLNCPPQANILKYYIIMTCRRRKLLEVVTCHPKEGGMTPPVLRFFKTGGNFSKLGGIPPPPMLAQHLGMGRGSTLLPWPIPPAPDRE